jgi:hypothetical protein
VQEVPRQVEVTQGEVAEGAVGGEGALEAGEALGGDVREAQGDVSDDPGVDNGCGSIVRGTS